MSYFKRVYRPSEFATLSNLFENVFDNITNTVGSDVVKSNPLVNIIEGENEFIIELAAPGLKKADFGIQLEKDLLTVSTKNEEKEDTESASYKRREFNFNNFERTFTLPETVDGEKIGAKYQNGVLKITLPLKEEEVVKNRKIEIV